jgi:hypothetical protein
MLSVWLTPRGGMPSTCCWMAGDNRRLTGWCTTAREASRSLTTVRVRPAVILFVLAILAVTAAACSASQAAAPSRHRALIALQNLTNDENALGRADVQYAQGTASPCPQTPSATPTLPSKPITCSNAPPVDSAKAAQLKAAVVRERTQVTNDREMYLKAKGNLPGLPNVSSTG